MCYTFNSEANKAQAEKITALLDEGFRRIRSRRVPELCQTTLEESNVPESEIAVVSDTGQLWFSAALTRAVHVAEPEQYPDWVPSALARRFSSQAIRNGFDHPELTKWLNAGKIRNWKWTDAEMRAPRKSA